VIAATNGKKAIELAKISPKPDIILLDIIMPDIDGYEVCKELKSDDKTADIPIIFVTAKTKKEDKEEGLKLGAVDYIKKPVTPEEVINAIKKYIKL
ncbi:MAG: response regulator, partial [Sulfurimonas sp.]|nr:response regulator [Sulfurimonas sp.]